MRRAKDALRCQNCGERVGAKLNYCGNCGAAIAKAPPEAVASAPGTAWPQRAESVAAPVDWPLWVIDEANSPLNIDHGVDLEPTIRSLVGPGSLIMPAPIAVSPPLAASPALEPSSPLVAPTSSMRART